MTEIPHMSEDEVEARHDDDASREKRAERERSERERRERETEPSTPKVFLGTGFFWGLVLGLILATAVVVLAAQNTADTTVRFLGWEFSMPLIGVILGSLLVGVVLAEIGGLAYRRRRRRILNEREELRRLRAGTGDDDG
jgi:uncharacterized integral membrane protein